MKFKKLTTNFQTIIISFLELIGLENKMKNFLEFYSYSRNKKIIIGIAIGVTILSLVNMIKSMDSNKIYVDKVGNIKYVELVDDEPISLDVIGKQNNHVSSKSITLASKAKEKKGKPKKAVNTKELLDLSIDRAIRHVKSSPNKKIALPQKLKDGTVLSWKKTHKSWIPYELGLIPLAAVFIYMNSNEKLKRKEILLKEDLAISLPTFNHQLLLLMNAGLIFSDAMDKIAANYLSEKPKLGTFKAVIASIKYDSNKLNISMIEGLKRYSKKAGNRDLTRIVGIISDNQYKGVDLREKLENESYLLWNQRIKLAEKKGKLAETKLSFPLAILLLVLILITAAPAMIRM